eukprot:Nitzschia sp. Nitz4//scaffold144_size56818//31461//32873//NITZ4_006538-RA/size56818-processed-gene-0.67-mRNA-1//1//CDS//3329536519//1053//frame0
MSSDKLTNLPTPPSPPVSTRDHLETDRYANSRSSTSARHPGEYVHTSWRRRPPSRSPEAPNTDHRLSSRYSSAYYAYGGGGPHSAPSDHRYSNPWTSESYRVDFDPPSYYRPSPPGSAPPHRGNYHHAYRYYSSRWEDRVAYKEDESLSGPTSPPQPPSRHQQHPNSRFWEDPDDFFVPSPPTVVPAMISNGPTTETPAVGSPARSSSPWDYRISKPAKLQRRLSGAATDHPSSRRDATAIPDLGMASTFEENFDKIPPSDSASVSLFRKSPSTIPKPEATNEGSSSRSQRAIRELNSYDVVCGRGRASLNPEGNEFFMDLVRRDQVDYIASRRKDKPAIAFKIIDTVHKYGGRFLRCGSNPRGGAIYFEMTQARTYEKVCQSLRDGAPLIRYRMQELEAHRSGRPMKQAVSNSSSNNNSKASILTDTTNQSNKAQDTQQKKEGPTRNVNNIRATNTDSPEEFPGGTDFV